MQGKSTDTKNSVKDIAIVCSVMKNELLELSRDNPNSPEFVFLEQHLHDNPDAMRMKLQEEIDKVTDDYGAIILYYGLCSNGVVGLKSDKHEIIIPRVDDCISLFLGSKKRYAEEFKKNPGTYYLCKGWIEYGSDPYRGYLVVTDQEDKIPEGFLKDKNRYGNKKYPKDVSRRIFAEMVRNYKKVLLIDNDDIEKVHLDYAKQMVSFMSEILNEEVSLVEVKGSKRLLKKLISGSWESDEILRIKPGQEVRQDYFIFND
jgi:hypothetical protein